MATGQAAGAAAALAAQARCSVRAVDVPTLRALLRAHGAIVPDLPDLRACPLRPANPAAGGGRTGAAGPGSRGPLSLS